MTQEDEILVLQTELQQNPKSAQFTKLAELYIARDMKDEAEALVRQSLKFHRSSTSGLILLGRVLKLKKKSNDAIEPLSRATQIAPDNWRAWLELAEAQLELKNGKLALNAFKRVLFLNPNQPLARRAVAKLEVLTADEYEAELFQMQKLPESMTSAPVKTVQNIGKWSEPGAELVRALSFADALILRHETERAIALLNECSEKFGSHPEIESRRLKLSIFERPQYIQPKFIAETSAAKKNLLDEKKIRVLRELLHRIETKKSDLLST